MGWLLVLCCHHLSPPLVQYSQPSCHHQSSALIGRPCTSPSGCTNHPHWNPIEWDRSATCIASQSGLSWTSPPRWSGIAAYRWCWLAPRRLHRGCQPNLASSDPSHYCAAQPPMRCCCPRLVVCALAGTVWSERKPSWRIHPQRTTWYRDRWHLSQSIAWPNPTWDCLSTFAQCCPVSVDCWVNYWW